MEAPIRISAALLCDAANVREGLINVISGGITRLWREELPAPMGVALALVLDIAPEECGLPHELGAVIVGPDGERLGDLRGGFQTERSDAMEAGERVLVPIVLQLQNVGVTGFGHHRVQLLIDSDEASSLDFWVLHPGERDAMEAMQIPDYPPAE